MASAKKASAIDVRIGDVGSILKFRIGFLVGENSTGFCRSVRLPGSILNFCIGSYIVGTGFDCRDPVCRHRFRFPDICDRSSCQLGGAEMTIILSDNNSWILTAPQSDPLEGGGGVNCPKLLSLYFLGKSDDNKNATFPNAVFPVL